MKLFDLLQFFVIIYIIRFIHLNNHHHSKSQGLGSSCVIFYSVCEDVCIL